MTQQLSTVMRIAAAKSQKLTCSKTTDLHQVTLQNQFVKDFNNVLDKNPVWFTVDDIELARSFGVPVQKKLVV
jgi:hypothetical protein